MSNDIKLEVLREFCEADRADFDATSIEAHPSGTPRLTAQFSDGAVVGIEIVEIGPDGGLPDLHGKYDNLPDSGMQVDLLLYCQTRHQPILDSAGKSADQLSQIEVDLLLSGGKMEPFKRIWVYERSTKTVWASRHQDTTKDKS